MKYLGTLLLLSMLLTSCASLPEGAAGMAPWDKNISWLDRTREQATLTTWDLNGAMAFKHGDKGGQARLHWQQRDPKHYTFVLTGPVGSGRVEIVGNPTQVTLKTADGKTSTAEDAQSLIRTETGWDVPVHYLYYWVRGLPEPTQPSQVEFDSYNHLVKLTQADWTITYQRYTRLGPFDVPEKLTLEKDTVRLRVLIKSWRKA